MTPLPTPTRAAYVSFFPLLTPDPPLDGAFGNECPLRARGASRRYREETPTSFSHPSILTTQFVSSADGVRG